MTTLFVTHATLCHYPSSFNLTKTSVPIDLTIVDLLALGRRDVEDEDAVLRFEPVKLPGTTDKGGEGLG